MNQFKSLHAVAVAAALLAGGIAPLSAQTQAQSDLVLFGPASNPGGLVGFIQSFENDPTEFYPAFLPAAANVPNNIGVVFYEDPSQTVLSDQIWTQAGFWYFASDPNLVNFPSLGITTVGALVEDGTQQDVSAFFLLPPGSMSVFSDVEVPEPAAGLFFGLGAGLWCLLNPRRTERA